MTSTPIEDYALIGDCETAALVSRTSTVWSRVGADVVLIALKARARIRGHIRMRALERTFDLRAGSLLTLDEGVPHDVEALEDSAVLLTIAWPGRDSQPVRSLSAGGPGH